MCEEGEGHVSTCTWSETSGSLQEVSCLVKFLLVLWISYHTDCDLVHFTVLCTGIWVFFFFLSFFFFSRTELPECNGIHWEPICLHLAMIFLIFTGTSYCVVYRVSQEECARLWESVPYVKVYRYNQNTYIPSWTVVEIMAREVWNFDSCYTLIDYQIHIKTGRNMLFL